MKLEFTPRQKDARAAFRSFASRHIAPFAEEFDRQERIPCETVKKLAAEGLLGSILPDQWGGRALDMITYGLLNEEIGRACSSVRSLLTVHDMVAFAILKWGNRQQRQSWLPKMAAGEVIGGFAVTEAAAGSDPKSVATTARAAGNSYLLYGEKKWISFGQIAGLFLVLAALDGRPAAFLVERDRPGVSVRPISGLLGTRASMLAVVNFDNCEVPATNLVGRAGFGLVSTILTALGLGRYSVGWGCVGIAQACVEASIDYAGRRAQYGALIREHQLIREMVSNMMTEASAARLLCCQAGYLKDAGDPREVAATFMAKYFASRAAMKAALDAVQIHGANGCGSEFPVQRYLRDAKVMEIIEGSNQIQQVTIADFGYQEHAGRHRFDQASAAG